MAHQDSFIPIMPHQDSLVCKKVFAERKCKVKSKERAAWELKAKKQPDASKDTTQRREKRERYYSIPNSFVTPINSTNSATNGNASGDSSQAAIFLVPRISYNSINASSSFGTMSMPHQNFPTSLITVSRFHSISCKSVDASSRFSLRFPESLVTLSMSHITISLPNNANASSRFVNISSCKNNNASSSKNDNA
ncbi:unnamed protein product [Dovyalis caffra]|uniref:Uncharacterized protein n=1 Tax=Dovyalis caffra TaxID=77055 RepID=A0AAV1RJY4_9ROSI|nr:unnamed protein product [Dovyalis caffra]